MNLEFVGRTFRNEDTGQRVEIAVFRPAHRLFGIPVSRFMTREEIASAIKDPKQRHGVPLRELKRAAAAFPTKSAQPA